MQAVLRKEEAFVRFLNIVVAALIAFVFGGLGALVEIRGAAVTQNPEWWAAIAAVIALFGTAAVGYLDRIYARHRLVITPTQPSFTLSEISLEFLLTNAGNRTLTLVDVH